MPLMFWDRINFHYTYEGPSTDIAVQRHSKNDIYLECLHFVR